MSWVDALGWFGSALLVFSLLQARILRLRVLNTVACVILTVFNAILEVWPMVAMNVVLAAINLWFIARLLRERHDETAYTVLEVEEDDVYLQHFLEGARHRHRPVLPEVPRGLGSGRLPRAARRRDRRRHPRPRRRRRHRPGRARLRHPAVPRLHAGRVRLPALGPASATGASAGCSPRRAWSSRTTPSSASRRSTTATPSTSADPRADAPGVTRVRFALHTSGGIILYYGT